MVCGMQPNRENARDEEKKNEKKEVKNNPNDIPMITFPLQFWFSSNAPHARFSISSLFISLRTANTNKQFSIALQIKYLFIQLSFALHFADSVTQTPSKESHSFCCWRICLVNENGEKTDLSQFFASFVAAVIFIIDFIHLSSIWKSHSSIITPTPPLTQSLTQHTCTFLRWTARIDWLKKSKHTDNLSPTNGVEAIKFHPFCMNQLKKHEERERAAFYKNQNVCKWLTCGRAQNASNALLMELNIVAFSEIR